jgi:ribose transport system ATP-binding protein
MSIQSSVRFSDNAPPLLQVTGANKAYHGTPALIDVSIELRGGEVHALVGENGAGKSTLIRLLAGVLPADSISIMIRGEPVNFREARDAFEAGLRFIHQELNVVPTLSVAENIFLSQPYPSRTGVFVRWNQLNGRARAVLAQLGVDHISPRQIMARLSPGDQMLVKIASAFVGGGIDPDGNLSAWVYVMDEPTAALNVEEAALLFNVIRRLQAQGCAVLYVSHRLDEIFKIADCVTVLRDGRVVTTTPIEHTTPADLIRMMTGRDLQQVYPPREVQAVVKEQILLDVHGLTTRSVKDISFQLKEGEILGIAGLKSSGRTELLRALMKADRVLGGQIALDSRGLASKSPAESWENGLAYVPEERRSQGLILNRSVSDNITLPHLRHVSHYGVLLNHRLERKTSDRAGTSVRLKAAGVRQVMRQLSGGNQQKTMFARALVRSPRVLLLDEPTRGVDVGAKYDIYTLIRRISASGTGIIMVSSELPELLGLCDRILVMRGGHLIKAVHADGLTEEELLALCYGDLSNDNRPTSD